MKAQRHDELLQTLKSRFDRHGHRHDGIAWADVQARLARSPGALRALRTLGEFDLKTSSWVATPPEVRALGGALFCDRRYGRVFVYHNGAASYYAARGFRGWLEA